MRATGIYRRIVSRSRNNRRICGFPPQHVRAPRPLTARLAQPRVSRIFGASQWRVGPLSSGAFKAPSVRTSSATCGFPRDVRCSLSPQGPCCSGCARARGRSRLGARCRPPRALRPRRDGSGRSVGSRVARHMQPRAAHDHGRLPRPPLSAALAQGRRRAARPGRARARVADVSLLLVGMSVFVCVCDFWNLEVGKGGSARARRCLARVPQIACG